MALFPHLLCPPRLSPPSSSLQVPLKRPPRRLSAAYCLVPILQKWKVRIQPAGCGLPGLRRDTAALAANAASILESLIDHRTSSAQSRRTHPPTSSHLPICLGRVESIQWMKDHLDPSSCSKNSPRNPPDATHLAPTNRKPQQLILRACKLLRIFHYYVLRTAYEYGPIGTLLRIPCHTADAVSAAAAGHELHLVFLASCARCLTRRPANPDNQAPIFHFHPMFHSPRLAACGLPGHDNIASLFTPT